MENDTKADIEGYRDIVKECITCAYLLVKLVSCPGKNPFQTSSRVTQSAPPFKSSSSCGKMKSVASPVSGSQSGSTAKMNDAEESLEGSEGLC